MRLGKSRWSLRCRQIWGGLGPWGAAAQDLWFPLVLAVVVLGFQVAVCGRA